jgi:hypothetical protein
LKYFGLGVQNKKPTKPVIAEKTVELPKEIKEAVKEKPEARELPKENVIKKISEKTVDEVPGKALKILKKIPEKAVVSSSEIVTKTHDKIGTPSKKTPGKKVKKRTADKTSIEKLSQNADLVHAKLQKKAKDDTGKLPEIGDISKDKLPEKQGQPPEEPEKAAKKDEETRDREISIKFHDVPEIVEEMSPVEIPVEETQETEIQKKSPEVVQHLVQNIIEQQKVPSTPKTSVHKLKEDKKKSTPRSGKKKSQKSQEKSQKNQESQEDSSQKRKRSTHLSEKQLKRPASDEAVEKVEKKRLRNSNSKPSQEIQMAVDPVVPAEKSKDSPNFSESNDGNSEKLREMVQQDESEGGADDQMKEIVDEADKPKILSNEVVRPPSSLSMGSIGSVSISQISIENF